MNEAGEINFTRNLHLAIVYLSYGTSYGIEIASV